MITKENYFDVNNKALTNSKIKDFLINKSYFYKKHISGELKQKKTTPLLIGSAVDDILSTLDGALNNKYVVVERRNLKNPPQDYIEVNQQQYDDIIGLADAVSKTDAYKELTDKKYVRQQILFTKRDLGRHFDYLAGIPDFYLIEGDECIIVDLKTTTSINERKYHFTCLEYGYYRQLALYAILLKEINPNIKRFRYYHLAVEKKPDIYNVATFELSGERVEEEKRILETYILPSISAEIDFLPPNPAFSTATLIGEVSGEDF